MSEAFDVGERFFSAIEAGDMEAVRDVYHPDVVVWHNTDGLANREQGQSREDNVALLTVLTKLVSDWKYDNRHAHGATRFLVHWGRALSLVN